MLCIAPTLHHLTPRSVLCGGGGVFAIRIDAGGNCFFMFIATRRAARVTHFLIILMPLLPPATKIWSLCVHKSILHLGVVNCGVQPHFLTCLFHFLWITM
jgi:hypothetical protein